MDPEWYEDFKNITLTQWSLVINNENVSDKYKYWEKILHKEYDETSYIVPVIFKYVEGNYCITNMLGYNCETYGIPNGSILNKIDGMEPDIYIKSLMSTTYLTYDFKRKKLIKNILGIFVEKDQEVKLTLKTPNGETIERTMKAEEYSYESANANTGNSKENATTKILVDKKIGYISIARMEQNYSKDQIKINNFIKEIKDYPYLIIDIRGNGGGSDSYWSQNIVQPLLNKPLNYEAFLVFRDGEYIKPFLQEKLRYREPITSIKDFPKEMKYPKEINGGFVGYTKLKYEMYPLNNREFKGKIYLLVDNGVYSSSESFAAFAKATKWATLVGTTTGGDGIGFDPCVASMPNSRLVFRFSLDMGLNSDGTVNEETHTIPDIYVEPSYEDMIKTIQWDNNKDGEINPYDTILNKTLEMIK